MPTMHGTGMHHHVHVKSEWKFTTYIKHLIALITGNSDRDTLKKKFDKFISVVGLIGPIMTTPQIINVWVYQNVEGLALLSWGTYVLTSSFWLLYGILHKERAIIMVNIAWIIANISVVTGILIFR